MKKYYVVSYDISNDRKRNKAAEALKDYGARVQKSVFECYLKPDALNKLIEKLKKIIDPKTDSIIVYPLCDYCVKQKTSYGISVFTGDEGYRVI